MVEKEKREDVDVMSLCLEKTLAIGYGIHGMKVGALQVQAAEEEPTVDWDQ